MRRYVNWALNAKIATLCRDLCPEYVLSLFRGFNQCADTAGAQSFTNRSPVLVYRDLLQVWFELSFGCPH
jgi:hypothetical protein